MHGLNLIMISGNKFFLFCQLKKDARKQVEQKLFQCLLKCRTPFLFQHYFNLTSDLLNINLRITINLLVYT